MEELIKKTLELGKVKITITKKDYTNNNFNRLHDQIRDKIFKGSSEKWKNYKPFLNGILDNLENDK